MFPREYRPLKRPRLGVPDFYPQDDKQREVRREIFGFGCDLMPPNFILQDELSFHTLNIGFRLPLLVDTQDEVGRSSSIHSLLHILMSPSYSMVLL